MIYCVTLCHSQFLIGRRGARMQAITLPPRTYLVGDPAFMVSPDDWDTMLALFRDQNPEGTFRAPRIGFAGKQLVLVPTAKAPVSFLENWYLTISSGFIAVMPIELVTEPIAELTKLQVPGASNEVKALEIVLSRYLTVEIYDYRFVVGGQEFVLPHGGEE